MTKSPAIVIFAGLFLFGCSAKATAPQEADVKSATPACKDGGCKDFKLTSCDELPANGEAGGIFKCKFSYALGDKPEVKTEEKCFIKEGAWRESVCL